MGKKKSPDKPDKNGMTPEQNSAEAAGFLSEMTGAAINNEGVFEVGRARDFLRVEMEKRRQQMAALNAQVEVLAAMDKAFDGWQGIAEPIKMPDTVARQPLTPKYTFENDDSKDGEQPAA